MADPNFTLLYVRNPGASAAFYARLLGKSPVEASPTFAMFALDSGAMLGLWATHTVEPPATAPGGSEIAFSVEGGEQSAPDRQSRPNRGICRFSLRAQLGL